MARALTEFFDKNDNILASLDCTAELGDDGWLDITPVRVTARVFRVAVRAELKVGERCLSNMKIPDNSHWIPDDPTTFVDFHWNMDVADRPELQDPIRTEHHD